MSVTGIATRTDPPANPTAEPVAEPVDFPPGLVIPPDADEAWWAHELTLAELADQLGIALKALDARRYRLAAGADVVLPPIAKRAHRYYCSRRAYHDWWVGLHEQRYRDLGRVERDRWVEAFLKGASVEAAVELRDELARVDALREQAAQMLKLADDLEASTLARLRP